MTFQTKLSNWWNKQHPAAKWYYKIQGGALIFFAIAGGIVITVDTVTGGMLESNRQQNLVRLGLAEEKTEQVETHTWRESLEEETNELDELNELGQTQEEETLSVIVKDKEERGSIRDEYENKNTTCEYMWENYTHGNPYIDKRYIVDGAKQVWSITKKWDPNKFERGECKYTIQGVVGTPQTYTYNYREFNMNTGKVETGKYQVRREWYLEGDKLIGYDRLETSYLHYNAGSTDKTEVNARVYK